MQLDSSNDSGLPSALDIAVLHTLIGTDPQAVVEVMSTYLQSIGAAAEELRQAVRAHDAKAAGAAAHLIKSPSLSVGAVPLGRLCQQLEHAASVGDWQTLATGFASFDEAMEQVLCAARACIATNGATP
jgi:HPt (histidine-containing phosphotransfer) domain-containing protein